MEFRSHDETCSGSVLAAHVWPAEDWVQRRVNVEKALADLRLGSRPGKDLNSTLINKEVAAAFLALVPELRKHPLHPRESPSSRLLALRLACRYIFDEEPAKYDSTLYDLAQVKTYCLLLS